MAPNGSEISSGFLYSEMPSLLNALPHGAARQVSLLETHAWEDRGLAEKVVLLVQTVITKWLGMDLESVLELCVP